MAVAKKKSVTKRKVKASKNLRLQENVSNRVFAMTFAFTVLSLLFLIIAIFKYQ